MKKDRIYLSPPNMGVEEIEQSRATISSGWMAPVGAALDRFEHELEKKFSDKRVLCLNSGTSALHLALVLSDVQSGDEVVVGSFTFAACANVVKYQGANLVFIDSESTTWNMDPELLRNYFLAGGKAKAVIATHLYGVPAKIYEIRKTCREFGAILIEDAAEALGSTFQGGQVGDFGDFGVVSFNGNKIITTSAGGALILSNEKYKRAKHLSTQANSGAFGYDHKEVGYNYRQSNLLASIGLEQLKKLNHFMGRKREIFNSYLTNLPSEVFEFPSEVNGVECNRWLTTPLIRKDSKISFEPIELIKFLDNVNIEARMLWKPLHLHQAYSHAAFSGNGIAEDLYHRGLCLPSGSGLSDEALQRVADAVGSFLSRY